MATPPPPIPESSRVWTWDKAAMQYNDAVGRSSRLGAAHLITLAATLHPFTVPSARAIDLGAGTGSLTHQLAAQNPDLPILATDISPAMLDQMMATSPQLPDQATTTTTTTTTNVTTQVLDRAAPLRSSSSSGGGSGLPPSDERTFTHVFSSMAIQVVRAPEEAGGVLAHRKKRYNGFELHLDNLGSVAEEVGEVVQVTGHQPSFTGSVSSAIGDPGPIEPVISTAGRSDCVVLRVSGVFHAENIVWSGSRSHYEI